VFKFLLAKKILIENGYSVIQSGKGSHVKFYNPKNKKSVVIPRSKEINKMMWQRLVKENDLVCNL